LGSSSLVFNFLFARFLVGTPVTSTDIYVSLNSLSHIFPHNTITKGTVVVVFGVVGIVAFGSINSGLTSETDVAHVTYLWRRAGWLGFFFCMSVALFVVGVGVVSLDAVLAERSEEGVATMDDELSPRIVTSKITNTSNSFVGRLTNTWNRMMMWVKDALERWTASRDEMQVAWMLGIGWACLGGGLAGGCLVFAKAT